MDFASIIKTISPWLGTALGGPLGGMAASALADALGASDKTQAGLKAAFEGATPDQMLAVKSADQAFSVKMQELGFADVETMAKLANDDRNSARQREMTVKDSTPMFLAYGVTAGFFALLGTLIFATVPAGGQTLMNVMVGSLGTAWISVIAYYFGSSSGSARKTELLAASTPPEQ